MSNYRTAHIDLQASRTELHVLLQLTGCEVSCNTLPKGACIPLCMRTCTMKNCISFSTGPARSL